MSSRIFISIDQNSHPLWDTVPKLAALARHGWRGTHCVEDIDIAFTRHGAAPGDTDLELAPERVYRGGTSDWGAALFYTDILGRQPFDIRRFETYTGWSTAALSRRLGRSVDALYDEYSTSDNWQLVGPSYAGETGWHRVIGDLRTTEVASFLLELTEHARRNLEHTFPEPDAQRRIREWFDRESALLRRLLVECDQGRLVDLYREWVRAHVPDSVTVTLTSDAFGLGHDRDSRCPLLAAFLSDYERLAACYNSAITDTAVGLKPLRVTDGELPFFVVCRRAERMTRATATLQDGLLAAGEHAWALADGGQRLPLRRMRQDGVVCVAGKALLLVLQVRLKPDGHALVLPHLGSAYMPAALEFENALREIGRMPAELHPVYRVKFNFIDHWRRCATTVRLPEYLHASFAASELRAAEFAEHLPRVRAQARSVLDSMTSAEGRQQVMAKLFAADTERRRQLEQRRRELARTPEGRAEASAIWEHVKELDRRLLEGMVDEAARSLRVLDLEYYDSRGALLPWCVALEGENLYDRLLTDADVFPEPAGEDADVARSCS